jgi:ribosomal protein S18 acetylase RimI-like enzyme
MDIKINVHFEEASEEVKQFLKQEWISANLTHFGRDISEEMNKPITITAYDESSPPQLVGVGLCLLIGNTLRLTHLLIKEGYRQKKGIGSRIVRRIEELAHEHKWHKIRLLTSDKHQNISFYLKQNYVIEAELMDDAFHSTWYILSKFINL